MHLENFWRLGERSLLAHQLANMPSLILDRLNGLGNLPFELRSLLRRVRFRRFLKDEFPEMLSLFPLEPCPQAAQFLDSLVASMALFSQRIYLGSKLFQALMNAFVFPCKTTP